MATYKKRGGKVRKPNLTDADDAQQINYDGESTTKEVFDALDESASKSEQWLEKNQKLVFIFLAVVLVGVLGYVVYNKAFQGPKEITAANELAFPKKYFEQASISAVATDSLYTLGLEGADGKYGFIDVASEFPGTKAGNLANYYAGISYLKMKKYPEAIEFLEKFSSDDEILGAVAKGAIGDAFADLNQPEDALEYYEKAAAERDNSFTTPLFLFKAGNTALDLGKSDRAQAMFEKIKKSFPKSEEAKNIDVYINKAKYAGK